MTYFLVTALINEDATSCINEDAKSVINEAAIGAIMAPRNPPSRLISCFTVSVASSIKYLTFLLTLQFY